MKFEFLKEFLVFPERTEGTVKVHFLGVAQVDAPLIHHNISSEEELRHAMGCCLPGSWGRLVFFYKDGVTSAEDISIARKGE